MKAIFIQGTRASAGSACNRAMAREVPKGAEFVVHGQFCLLVYPLSTAFVLVSDGLPVHVSVCVCERTREFAYALKEEEKERNIPTLK